MALIPLVLVSKYSGANHGAKMNAADADLGASPGIVVSEPGGSHTGMSRVVMSDNRTLILGLGTYEPDSTLTGRGNFIFGNHCRIVGHGRGTVLKEQNKTGQDAKAVFQDSGSYGGGSYNPTADGPSDCYFADFQILGNSPDFDSAVPTFGTANSHDVTVERVFFNATCSIGLNAGGSSISGYHGTGIRFRDCVFINVASQNVGFVNCRDFECTGCTFYAGGQSGGPGASYIDCEPNTATDWMDTFTISGNKIYAAGSFNAGNGIIVQAGAGAGGEMPRCGTVSNNIIYGSIFAIATETDDLSNGIVISGCEDIVVANNELRGCKQAGILVGGDARRIDFTGNQIVQCGGGGAASVDFAQCNDCDFRGNVLRFYTGTNQGSCGNWILEGTGSSNNRFIGNEIGSFSGGKGCIILRGTGSIEQDNTFDGIKARCMEVDGAIEANTLVKRSTTVARGATQFLTTDTAPDMLGVCIGISNTNGIRDIALVVTDTSVPVGIKSDGNGTIGIGASIIPSPSVNGKVRQGSSGRVGTNDNAAVAATLDDLCTATLLFTA